MKCWSVFPLELTNAFGLPFLTNIRTRNNFKDAWWASWAQPWNELGGWCETANRNIGTNECGVEARAPAPCAIMWNVLGGSSREFSEGGGPHPLHPPSCCTSEHPASPFLSLLTTFLAPRFLARDEGSENESHPRIKPRRRLFFTVSR